MQSLVYVPPNGSYGRLDTCVELTLKDGYILSTVSNVGAVEHTLITEDIPGVDGTHVLAERVESREIPCTVYVHGKSREDMYRRRFELIKSLSGKTEGWLYYSNDYITVRIRARPVLPGNFTERLAEYNKCDIKFHCADPNWQGLQLNSAHIAYTDGVGLHFPTTFNSIVFGTRTMRIEIDCQSSTATPITVIIEGQAEHPTLRNQTTGESLRFENLSMADGDIVTVDTTPGKLSAVAIIDGKTAKAFNLISPTSTFWQLQPGTNVITYSSDDDSQNAKIAIEWFNRYEGV